MYRGKFDQQYRNAEGTPELQEAVRERKVAREEAAAAAAENAPRRKGPRIGGVIFYTLYFLFVGAFVLGLNFASKWLDSYLTDYQAAQPTTRCEEVFQQLFADPDWAALYVTAGIADTEYEGAEAFAAYMEAKVGDSQLSYMETSAGLSGDKKYFITMGDERIGYFTLTSPTETERGIPNWQLGTVELYYQCRESVTVQKLDGYTVYINGVPLDDSHTISSIYTVAESYLPVDVNGLRLETQYAEGFLVEPEVTVLNENGENVPVTYDAEQDIYIVEIPENDTNTISAEDEETVIHAAETFALFMIEKASKADLLVYFDSESNVYTAISRMDMWMQNSASHEMTGQTVTDYYRYSDTLFSARVSLTLSVTRTNGTVKDYQVDTTLFFELQEGTWKCIEMTNVDVQEQICEVRITFVCDGTELSSKFYPNDTRQISAPVVSAPEGQVFAGWYETIVDAEGNTTYKLVFTPDENGLVTIPEGTTLNPMTLVALFEDAAAQTDTEGA